MQVLLTSTACAFEGPDILEDFSAGGYKDEDSSDKIRKMVDLALGKMGLTEVRATTVIVNDADATVENTDWNLSSKAVNAHSHLPYPFLKKNRSETVSLLMTHGVNHRKSGV